MRRPDVVAVHSLDHVGFDVPDLAEARRFYSAFGLDVKDAGAGLHVHTHGDPRPWLVIGQRQAGASEATKRKTLRWLSFGAYEEDLPAIGARLETLGKRVEPPVREDGRALFFQGPHGVIFEVRATPKRTIDQPETFAAAGRTKGRGAPLRSDAPAVRPHRLSHALLFSPDLAESIAFATEGLGLRLSDHAGAVAFLHAPHGSDHHVLAFAKGSSAGLHHVAWAVSSFDDVGLGAMQMADKGYVRGWGLGRHVLGSNYFHYVRDPWGSYSEYSHDIDHVSSDKEWPATEHTPENGFYLWGPTVPDDFVTNYEAEDPPA